MARSGERAQPPKDVEPCGVGVEWPGVQADVGKGNALNMISFAADALREDEACRQDS